MNLKSQKGSITLFVLVSCLFFLASVACVNMYMQSKQVAVDREYRQIKATYEKDINNMDSIYTELSNKNNLIVNFGVPEFDKTQNKVFINVFTNLEYLNIDTLKYGWYSCDKEHEEDVNEISINLVENWTYVEYQNGENEFIASTNLSENNIYYYLCVVIDNKAVWKKAYDYINEGMVLHYDGINNEGLGDKHHNSYATTWKNLCSNEHDGVLSTTETNGPIWGNDHLSLDGVDDWVNAGVINSNFQSIEVVFSVGEYKNTIRHIFGDKQVGGGGIAVNPNNKIYGEYYIGNGYVGDTILSTYTPEKKYNAALTYDGNIVKCYLNGNLVVQKTANGVIGANDTVMAIGADPAGSNAAGKYLNGKVYSARVYNRALSDDGIKQNYNVDKIRFNIED